MMRFVFATLCLVVLGQAAPYIGDADQTLPAVNVKFEFAASAASAGHFQDLAAFNQRVKEVVDGTSHDSQMLADFLATANDQLDELAIATRASAFLAMKQAPSFPEGVDSIVSDVASTVKSADKPAGDEAAALAKLESDGKKTLEGDVASEAAATEAAEAAYAAASEQAAKLLHAGGCPRDYSGSCPSGWSEAGGACEPAGNYNGPCAAGAVGNKEEFAVKCRASWPCAACTRDYSGCPAGWSEADGLCTAPASYKGACSTAMDFSGFGGKQKAELAAMCGYAFPCASEGASFMQKKTRSNRDLGAAIGAAIKDTGASEVSQLDQEVLTNPALAAIINEANARR